MFKELFVDAGKVRSEIREIFEYAIKRKAEIGDEKVYDFSIGNPSIPAPKCVDDAIKELVDHYDSIALHGYTSAPGDLQVRNIIAKHINDKYDAGISTANIYMTSGAAASISIVLNSILKDGDECIVFKPYFPEYKVFAENALGKIVEVETEDNTLQIDIEKLENAINEKTKAIIINSPNNPSGVVYAKDRIEKMCELLRKKESEFGHPIFLVSDEPYRELVYDGVEVPFLTKYYDDTFVCYSYSKALSIPGERIGYILVSPSMYNYEDAYAAVCGAGRAMGYVCASSMYQRVIAKCIGQTVDISIYKKNRDLLYTSLSELGYECVRPDGAFYLFVKAMGGDSKAFAEAGKKHELLFVPADSFGMPGYVRISYCVDTKMIIDSLPMFEALADEYK